METNEQGLPPWTEGAKPVLIVEKEGSDEVLARVMHEEASELIAEAVMVSPFSHMEWECVLGGIRSAPRAGKTYRVIWKR